MIEVIVGPVIDRDTLSGRSVPGIDVEWKERRYESRCVVTEVVPADLPVIVGKPVRKCFRFREQQKSDVFVRPTFMDGDAISVREAGTLGVPVVASNVGTRPEGTVLFEVGNKSQLVKQILACLKN